MKKKSSKKFPVGQWLGYAVLIVLAIISIGPIWIAFKTALSGPTAGSPARDHSCRTRQRFLISKGCSVSSDPSDPRITQTGMAKIDFFRALLNSVIFTALAVIPQHLSLARPLLMRSLS